MSAVFISEDEIMESNGSRTTFIAGQRAALINEMTQSHQRANAAQQSVDTSYQAALQAARVMRAPYDAAIALVRKQVLERARKGSWRPALTLRAFSGGGKPMLATWIALATFAFFTGGARIWGALQMSMYWDDHPVMVLINVLWLSKWFLAAYALLVWIGRKRLAKRAAANELAALEQLGKYQLQPHAFGQKHTDGRSHPYPAVRVPSPNPADPTDSWNLSETHDNSGAVLIGISSQFDKDVAGFIRLPLNNHPAGYIVVAGISSTERQLYTRVAEAAAVEMAALAAPVTQLYAACEPLQREQQLQHSLQTQLASLDKLETNWQDVAVPDDTLETIIKLVDRFAAGTPPLPKGILLWGPPGTGKTLIARKLAQHVNCNFVAVTIADLKAEFIGQTGPKVKKVWEDARKNGPTILFVDECESAFARRGGTDTDAFGNELVQTFIAEWDGFNQGGGNVLVIGATNRRELIDDAVMSRFTTSIELPAPNAEARHRILSAEFTKARIALPVTEALVRETTGMSGRDLSTLVTSVVSTHASGNPSLEEFLAAVGRLRGKSSTSLQQLGWDDVILPAATRAEFESLGKELLHAEELSKMNIPVPRGILLYGPPGTGKTQIARVLASQSGLSFIAASSSDIKSNKIGESGIKVKNLFEKARSQAPCILFLDEIDTIAGSRNGGDVMTTEIVAQLLQELDGVATKKGQVFLLAASNHADNIDGALLSRLERKILIDLPDATARAAILRLQLAGKPLGFAAEEVLDALANATEGSSGRDLQSLITAGTRRAMQRAMAEHGDPTKLQIQPHDLLVEAGITAS
jgi:transitional endoplasmic reticulum ATPase